MTTPKIEALPDWMQICIFIGVVVASVALIIVVCTGSCAAVKWADYTWPVAQ